MVNEQVTTIELTAGTPSTVEFSGAYPYYWVDNRSAGDVYASLGTPEAGTDGTYTIAAGSQLRISGGAFNTKLTLLGSGKVQVIASAIASCPFKGVQGGGDYAVAGASSYTLNNTVDYPLLGLNLYGKSTQDGTPTPEAPVDIVSVGDGGSVSVQACGKNLFDYSILKGSSYNGITYTNNNDGSFTVSGAKADISVLSFCTYKCNHKESLQIISSPGTYTISGVPKDYGVGLHFYVNFYYGEITKYGFLSTSENRTNTVTEDMFTEDFHIDIGFYSAPNYECNNGTFYPQLEKGSTATDFEPYKGNIASITTALPLCGIPVSEGGNYTDGNGQRWVCDELVYNADGTGKIIKRFGKFIVDGTESSYKNQSEITPEIAILDTKFEPIKNPKYVTITALVMSDIFKADTAGNTWKGVNDNSIAINRYGTNLVPAVRVYSSKFTNIDDAKTYFTNNPMTFIAELGTPQEISLSAAEMAALRELQTYSGITNISNGSSADMDVSYCTNKMLSKYVMPITTGLQKQIDELKAAVISLGGNV